MKALAALGLILFANCATATSVLCSYGFGGDGVPPKSLLTPAERNCQYSCPLNVASPASCRVVRGECPNVEAVSWHYAGGPDGVMSFQASADMWCRVPRSIQYSPALSRQTQTSCILNAEIRQQKCLRRHSAEGSDSCLQNYESAVADCAN